MYLYMYVHVKQIVAFTGFQTTRAPRTRKSRCLFMKTQRAKVNAEELWGDRWFVGNPRGMP